MEDNPIRKWESVAKRAGGQKVVRVIKKTGYKGRLMRVWSLCSATREATIVRGPRTAMKSGPCLPQLEKALAQKRRPNTAKNKLIN